MQTVMQPLRVSRWRSSGPFNRGNVSGRLQGARWCADAGDFRKAAEAGGFTGNIIVGTDLEPAPSREVTRQ